MDKQLFTPTPEYRLTPRGERLRSLGRKAVATIAGSVVAVSLAPHAAEAGRDLMNPEIHGTVSYTVKPGETIDTIVNEHVDGGASHTGAVREYIVENPENEATLEDGHINPGEELIIPRSVE